jgi:hypothetical protein
MAARPIFVLHCAKALAQARRSCRFAVKQSQGLPVNPAARVEIEKRRLTTLRVLLAL